MGGRKAGTLSVIVAPSGTAPQTQPSPPQAAGGSIGRRSARFLRNGLSSLMHALVKPDPAPPSMAAGARLALKLAWRDLRGGLRGFGVFIACLALGVMTIAAVTSASRGLTEGLSREGRRILGGDAAFQPGASRGDAGRSSPSCTGARRCVQHRHHARHGQCRRERRGSGRDQGRRRLLSQPRRGRVRTGGSPCPRCFR